MDRLLRLPEVARLLAAEEPFVVELIRFGQLDALELAPGQWRVAASDLRRFVRCRRWDFSATCEAQLKSDP